MNDEDRPAPDLSAEAEVRLRASLTRRAAAADGVTVPDPAHLRSGDRGAGRGRRRSLLLAAAAAVVLAVVGVVVASGDRGQAVRTRPEQSAPTTTDPAPTTSPAPPGWVPDRWRDEFPFVNQAGIEAGVGPDVVGTVVLAHDDRPRVFAQVLNTPVLPVDASGPGGGPTTPFEVDGHPAVAWIDDGAQVVVVRPVPGRTVALAGLGLDRQRLAALAAAIDVELPAADPDLLPDGWTQWDDDDGVAALGTGLSFGVAHGAFVSLAASGTGAAGTLALTWSRVADPDAAIEAVATLWGDAGRPTIGGRRGLLLPTRNGSSGLVVVWPLDDGYLGVLAGFDIDTATLLGVAPTVRPATTEEWAELERRIPEAPAGTTGFVEPARDDLIASGDDGVRWSIATGPPLRPGEAASVVVQAEAGDDLLVVSLEPGPVPTGTLGVIDQVRVGDHALTVFVAAVRPTDTRLTMGELDGEPIGAPLPESFGPSASVHVLVSRAVDTPGTDVGATLTGTGPDGTPVRLAWTP